MVEQTWSNFVELLEPNNVALVESDDEKYQRSKLLLSFDCNVYIYLYCNNNCYCFYSGYILFYQKHLLIQTFKPKD